MVSDKLGQGSGSLLTNNINNVFDFYSHGARHEYEINKKFDKWK